MKQRVAESDLAASVVARLERCGWTVYQEVEYRQARADIVAVRGQLLYVVECKITFCFALLEQAVRWLQYANLVSVAATGGSGRGELCKTICASLGLGWLTVTFGEVDEYVAPVLRRRVSEKIRTLLRPEHQQYAKAGTNGRYFSEWRATTARLVEAVCADPGLPIKELVHRIPHHYATEKSARDCLIRDIERGIIQGVEVRREPWSHAPRLYPVESEDLPRGIS